MGIKSTKDIPRHQAIDRLETVRDIIKDSNYTELESITCEDECIESFLTRSNNLVSQLLNADLDKYTNSMLEDLIDHPFFRYSMFDNYTISD